VSLLHVNTCKRNSIATLLSQPELNIDDLESDYLSLVGGTSPHVNDAWLEVFKEHGATADHRSQAAQEFLLLQGAPNENITDNWHWFWCVNGGIIDIGTINMLDRDGLSYEVILGIPDRNGVLHIIPDVFLDRDGNPLTVI